MSYSIKKLTYTCMFAISQEGDHCLQVWRESDFISRKLQSAGIFFCLKKKNHYAPVS